MLFKFTNLLIFSTFLFHFINTHAQINNQKPIVAIVINENETDSTANEKFKELFNKYTNNAWGTAIPVANQAIDVLKKRKNNKFVTYWHRQLGFLYLKHDIYTLALDVYYSGLKYTQNLPVEKAYLYNDIARIYLSMNIDLYHAERYLLSSLKIQEQIKNQNTKKKLQAYTNNQLGIIYERKTKYKKARAYYKKALDMRLQIKDTAGLANSYYTIGYFYNSTGNKDSALFFYNKGLEIAKSADMKISYLLKRALIYALKNKFDLALADIDNAMALANTQLNKDLSRILKTKSEIYDYQENTLKAIELAEQALAEADKYNQSSIKLKLYPLIISYYKKQKNYRKVSDYQAAYFNFYRLKYKEREKIIQKYILKKEDKTISLLEADRKKLQKTNRMMYLLIAALLILLFASIILTIYYFKNKQKLNENSLKVKTQAIIAQILGNITGKERNIEEFLQNALKIILEIPWLRFETKGAIFLTNEEGNLRMVAHENLGASLLKMCAIVKPGECLCGKVLKYKKTLHCDHVGDQHDFRPEGMTPHGHYNIPFLFHNKVLGVLTLYLKEGHKKEEYEVKFLETVAASISSVINRKSIQEKLRLQAIEQEKLNQKLFAQKLELEQRNIEIKQYAKQQDALNQKFFAQTLELDQRNIEIKQYSKKLEEQKKQIEEAHRDVTDSITYAQTIQEALLPKKEQLDALFQEYFIFFQPKQVVSGDFYSAQKVGDKLVFTVADCTGHGVPGGFITMLGITFISELIHHREVKNSAEILEILRTNIKGIFAEFGTKNTNGFDISFCVVDTKTNVLSFAGAYNSLYILRNGELIEYKGTKNPIGWHPKETTFTESKVQLQNNDIIYLFTDGYYDQIGENKKKFLRKRFKMLLTEIHDLPMKEQKRILKGIFDKWKGKEPQTDDVTVMGIKWKM
ncbi:MAG: SpoIIE family protein phosphatase [Bacteroidales bacterium]|nr:SpoIIE family protein phosphatase [Bacteroidales bacterium]